MREFFRGWRQKVGCVTLVMAATLMCMWMRSRFVEDYFEIAIWRILSQDGSLSCSARALYMQTPYWGSHVLQPEGPIGEPFRFQTPYWLLILPLTLLSAYLILWKPRKQPGPYHA